MFLNYKLIVAQRQEMQKKHREAILQTQSKPHNLPYVKAQCEKEIEVSFLEP